MCALIQEMAVPIGDLTRVAIDCPQCESTFTVELKNSGAVPFCTVCHYDFAAPLRRALENLATALDFLVKSDARVTFRIPLPSDARAVQEEGSHEH